MSEKKNSRYFVPSERLRELRLFLQAWRDATQNLQTAIQLRVVVDTNVVLGDIRWLATKRRVKNARTSLLEVLDAGTLEVFAPSELLGEVETHIDRIAREDRLDSHQMREIWSEYRKKLSILDADTSMIERYRGGVDPDDAAFVALAEGVKAAGVISNDQHIALMGGRRISVDFVISLRDYSRAAAIELNLKCMGIVVSAVGVATISAMLGGLRHVALAIARAPDWVKLTLILGVAFCAVHPGARQRISAGFERALQGIAQATPSILSSLAEAAKHAEEQHDLAQVHLTRALKELA